MCMIAKSIRPQKINGVHVAKKKIASLFSNVYVINFKNLISGFTAKMIGKKIET